MSYVTIYFILFIVFGQSGEAYRWRVCYQRGLLRLVFKVPVLGSRISPYVRFHQECGMTLCNCFFLFVLQQLLFLSDLIVETSQTFSILI